LKLFNEGIHISGDTVEISYNITQLCVLCVLFRI